MFLKTVGTIARFSLLLLPVVAITTVNCGDGGNGGTAGTSGTAGADRKRRDDRRRWATGTAGTGGGGGFVHAGRRAPPPTSTILDWEGAAAGATTSSFGDYMPGTYGGGTFEYPGPAPGSPCDPDDAPLPQLRRQELAHHGPVRDYSGFGLYLTSKMGRVDVHRAPVRHQRNVHRHRRRRRRRAGGVGHHDRHRRAATRWTAPTPRTPA